MNVDPVKPAPKPIKPATAPAPRAGSLSEMFNMSAASMGVLASMPSVPTPLSMAAVVGASSAVNMLIQPSPPPRHPRQDRALSFNPASFTVPSLLNGLQDNSFAAGIMKAAADGDAATLRLLLEKRDTLPDFINAYGISPLMAAAARGQAETAELLAAHPLVNLARAEKEGWTALHFAAHLNQSHVVALLLKHHAPFDMVTAKGHLAFDLADAETQALFLQDKNFKRFLKSRAPEHPLLQPPPAKEQDPPPETAADADEPQEENKHEPLQQSLYDALKDIGVTLQKNTSSDARVLLSAKLAEMDTRHLSDAYRRIAQTGAKYDWDDVFIRAAGEGNTEALVFLQDEIYFEQRTLNRALWQAAATGQRDAAHHLMLWEADPLFSQKNAKGEKISAIDTAWARRGIDVIEEMALWSDTRKTLPAIERYLAETKARMVTQEDRKRRDGQAYGDLFMPLISLSAMQKRRDELASDKTGRLRDSFAKAAQSGNITEILASYAEAQRPRLFRGKVAFDGSAGGSAIGWALVHGRVEFARKLAADGYKLGDAPQSLRDKALHAKSGIARDFARDNLAGRKHYPRIEETGKRSTSPSAIRQLRTGLYID